jgi:predicted amidohydrolase YtcJ
MSRSGRDGYTRGEFLGLLGVAGGGLVGGGAAGGHFLTHGPDEGTDRSAPADLIVVNARIYTVDAGQPRAQALAVKHGRFLAVGSNDDVRHLAGPDTTVLDAEGMTVTPGFIDTHSHASGTAELFGPDLLDARTIQEIQVTLAQAARDIPEVMWVSAGGYDDTKVVDQATGRYRRLTRWDLDEAVPDKPVRVSHRGGHLSWYNSRALELAGVDRDTPDTQGGRLARRDDGELTGLAEGQMGGLFSGVAQNRSFSRDEQREGLAYITRRMAATGITSVHRTGGGTGSLATLQDAYEAGELSVRMYQFMSGGAFRTVRDAGLRTGFGDEWVRLGGVKWSSDGSASGRTMRMSEPYAGRPDDYGILYMSQEQLDESVEEAHRAGWQIGIHANGDVAIDMVLRAFERAQERWPRPDPRHRIEHCSLVNPDLLRRIRDGGYIPTPFWTYVYYHGDKWHEYGQERLEWMFAHRSFLDYDIPVPGASDYRPGPYEPLMAIQSMVTRRDWEGNVWGPTQRVSVEEALRIGTIHGAHASFEEGIKGSITPGKLADFVMLGRDPHEVDPEEIMEIPVVRTVVGGRTVHEG